MGDGPEGDDEDNEEANKDMKLFGKKKRPGNFAHKKGFNAGGNKSFARKRPRKN